MTNKPKAKERCIRLVRRAVKALIKFPCTVLFVCTLRPAAIPFRSLYTEVRQWTHKQHQFHQTRLTLLFRSLNPTAAANGWIYLPFNYRIFSNLIRTLFTVSEGQKIICGLESRVD